MSDLMTPFREVINNRHGWIKDYKSKSNRQLCGYFCDYVPEEVLWAAGITTVRITGGSGNVTAADKHMQSNVCSFARRCLDQALEGVFDYLDGLVIPHTCDIMTKMYDLWAYRLKKPDFLHYLWVPHKVFDPSSVSVMTGEFNRLKKCVEEHFDTRITPESLKEAIALFNKNRSLLKRVYQLRATSPPIISGEDAFTISLASLFAPKDLHNEWMEAFLAEHEGKNATLEDRPRIMISASMLEDLDLIHAVEDAGAWVVTDEVCSGTRYFYDLVDEEEKDPVKALVLRYLNKLPCPRSVGALDRRHEHILNLSKEYKVDGLIFYILRCCDAHLFEYSLLKERLKDADFKLLYMQGDQSVGINEGQINRIKAFTEMIAL